MITNAKPVKPAPKPTPASGPRLAPALLPAKTRKRKAKRCVAITKAGERCPNAAMGGTKCCNFHWSGYAAKAGQIGGHRRAIYRPDDLVPFAAPSTMAELVTAISTVAEETYKGKLDPRVSQVVGTHLHTLVEALQMMECGRELRALCDELGVDVKKELVQ